LAGELALGLMAGLAWMGAAWWWLGSKALASLSSTLFCSGLCKLCIVGLPGEGPGLPFAGSGKGVGAEMAMFQGLSSHRLGGCPPTQIGKLQNIL